MRMEIKEISGVKVILVGKETRSKELGQDKIKIQPCFRVYTLSFKCLE